MRSIRGRRSKRFRCNSSRGPPLPSTTIATRPIAKRMVAMFPTQDTLTGGVRESRIVITGVGALSPNGVGRERYFAALAAGHSGVRPITQFDASSLPCRVAGEVNGEFDPSRWVDAKNMKHVSRVVPMAIAAADEALRDAGIDPSQFDLETRRRFAVMLGSGGGAIEFSERMYELWYKGATKQASIYAIPSGTIGTIASEISMAYDLHGFSHLISTGCTSSTDALVYAFRNRNLGVADYVLAGVADAPIP